MYIVRNPRIYEIVSCAYGVERGGKLEVNDKVLKEQYQNVMQCILSGGKIPKNLLQMLVSNASSPQRYSSAVYGKILAVACAVVCKYYNMIREGDETMGIDLKTTKDRSCLFGMLLATLEKVEKDTYRNGESRTANAIKLQSVYVNHPLATLQKLEEKLKPYYQKLDKKLDNKQNSDNQERRMTATEYYKKMIADIIYRINKNVESDKMEEFDRPLEPTYLIGYYLQRKELYTSHKDNKKENEED